MIRRWVAGALKSSIAHLLYWLGVLQLWQRTALRGKAVVLMYHRVLTHDERGKTGSHPSIVVDCEAFSEQMATLKQRFKVLSLEEFSSRMENGIPFEDGSCLVTFDDGWRDNYMHALPILRQYGIPAVVFLPVNFIGTRRLFWQEYLTHLTVRAVMRVRQEPSQRGRLGELFAPLGLASVFDLRDRDPRPAIMDLVRRHKNLSPSLINATLANVAEELGVQGEEYAGLDSFLDWEQVLSMTREGIVFGGHGAEHRILTFVSLDEAWEEIGTAKQVIGDHLRASVRTFSYPNGNYSQDVAELVKKAGYQLAFTTKPGFVSCEDDCFTIRRIGIHQGLKASRPLFLARIMGLF